MSVYMGTDCECTSNNKWRGENVLTARVSVGRWSTEQFRKHMCSILSRGQAEEIEAMNTGEIRIAEGKETGINYAYFEAHMPGE